MKINKKYLSDYSIRRIMAPNGQIREEATYIGKYYRFQLPREERRKKGIPVLFLALLALLLFLYPLCTVNEISHNGLVILPHTLTCFAAYYFLRGFLPSLGKDKKYQRDEADRIDFLVNASAGCGIAAALMALVMGLIWTIRHPDYGLLTRNLLAEACDLLLVILFILLKKQKTLLTFEETN